MAGLKLKIDATQAERASQQLRRDLKQLGAESVLTEKEVKQLEARMRRGMAADEAKRAMDRIRRSTRMSRREFDRFERKVAGSAATWQKFAAASKRAVGTLMSIKAAVAGVGLGLLMADIARTGAQFEQTMAEVKGITGATGAEFKALESIAREMGETTEWTAKQSAEALKFMAMAGFEAREAIGALPQVLDLATAGHIELGRAADIATNALTAFRLDVEELGRVNDVMIQTITTSNTNMEMLAESFKYSASMAAGFGYEIEELTTYIGLLGNAGIQGSMAGTQLAMTMQQVPKVFEHYGKSVQDATGETKDLLDALKLLERQGADTVEVMEIFTARSGRSVTALLGMGTDVIERYMEVIRGAEGASRSLAEIMRGTTIGAFKELKSAVEGVKIDIFTENSGELNELIQDMTRYVRENKDELVELGNSLASVAMDMGRVVGAAGNLIAELGRLPRAASNIGKALGLVMGGDLSLMQLGAATAGADSAEKLSQLIREYEENPVLFQLRQRLRRKQMELAEGSEEKNLAELALGERQMSPEEQKKLLQEIQLLKAAITDEEKRQAEIEARRERERKRLEEARELHREIQQRKRAIDMAQKEAEFRQIAAESAKDELQAEIEAIEQKYERERVLAKGNQSLLQAINQAEAAELADLYEKQRRNKIREYEQAYKVTGEMTREHYALLRGQIQAEKEEFIRATGDKVQAARMAAAKMGELNARFYGTPKDRWQYEAEQAPEREAFAEQLIEQRRERRAQARAEFSEAYKRQKLSQFEYEREQLEEQARAWKQAGVEKLKVEQWLMEELERLQDERKKRRERELEDRLAASESWVDGTKLFLHRFEREQASTAEKVASIWDSTFSGLGDAFGNLFSDVVSGEMKDLADYARQFAQSIARSLGQSVSGRVEEWAAFGLESLVGMFDTPKTIPTTTAAPPDLGYPGYGLASGGWINEPVVGMGLQSGARYALGEAGPELVIPKDRVGGSAPKVEVNVIDRTTEQKEVTHDKPRWQGDRWVMNVVLDAANRNKNGFGRNLKAALGKA